MSDELPVQAILPRLIETLRSGGTALLEASPGAGKSTLVPPALYEAGLGKGRKIYMIEPRRLAARSLAHFISRELGDGVGGICGYRVHRETKVSSRTAIEVITEGILIRMLQSDPALEEAGAVIFDEFHERNILSDLGLTLLLEVRDTLRDDLTLLFMSATPDCEALLRLIPDLPLVRSEGRQYPVEKFYRPLGASKRFLPVPEETIGEALSGSGGDVLVFLPGEGEIRRWQGVLSRSAALSRYSAEVLPLFGRMPLEEQSRVISPARSGGRRRVILSTDIAETSLTIPGITVVVDTGLTRRPLYNASSGLTLLSTEEISLASAEQRAGRAGRTAPGVCYRLWEQGQERSRDGQTPPEILQADLAPLVLEMARWGCSDPQERRWMTPPPGASWQSGAELLSLLGAVDPEGGITDRGRKMADLPVHPRVAALLLFGAETDRVREACLLAAFLEQRDFLPGARGSDILLRLDYLTGERSPGEYIRPVREIRAEAEHLSGLLTGRKSPGRSSWSFPREEGARLLAQAYPDRIGMRLEEGIYQLSGGGRIVLERDDPLRIHPLLVAAHCGGHRDRQKLFLGLPIGRKELEGLFEDRIVRESHGRWEKNRLRCETRRRLGVLTLSVTPEACPDEETAARILGEALSAGGREILPWDRESRRLYGRMIFTGEQKGEGEWPDLSDRALAQKVALWLVPFLSEGKLAGTLSQPLLSLLSWDQQQELDRTAPDTYRTALGNRRKIVYGEGEPYLPVPLQEMYGAAESPRLGRRPLVLHLLNPAGRAVQVTSDLAGFWERGWPAVRSELRGRYPKHYWPEKPAEAAPSLKTGKNRPQ